MTAEQESRISTADAERLMKRCQIGVGGRNALNDAHDIMADCYGTIGALVHERDALLSMERRIRRAQEMATSDHPKVTKEWHDAEIRAALMWRDTQSNHLPSGGGA